MDLLSYFLGKKEGSGDKPTGTIDITFNGTHNVTAYASAQVAVPNTYTAEDEGKVVHNGELVVQPDATGVDF